MEKNAEKQLYELHKWLSSYSSLLPILLKDTRYTKKQIEKILAQTK